MTRFLSLRFLLPAGALIVLATLFQVHSSTAPLHRIAAITPPADGDAGQRDPARTADGQAWYDRTFPRRTIPPDAYTRGIRQAQDMSRARQIAGWKELGPLEVPDSNVPNPDNFTATSVSGRVTAIAVDPTTCSGDSCRTIYVGAATGGVWKSTDAGASWDALTDSQPDLAVGVITLDPKNPNIVYVGTGDPDHGSGSRRGIGVLQSTDGGRTWSDLGYDQLANRAVSAIVVDPRTAGTPNATLYVTTARAASGGATTGGGSSSTNPDLPALGFYRGSGGGKQWVLSNPTDAGNDSTGGAQGQSLAMSPADPNRLFAAFDSAGIYTSTDDGQTWAQLTNGLPDFFSFIRLAISQSNPQVLYAAFDASVDGGGPEHLFRSHDGGASWTQLKNAPNACADQCFANMHLAVDPSNPNILYAGGTANYGYLFSDVQKCTLLSPLPRACNTALMKSSDGGKTWSDIAENGSGGPLHPDNHAIVIDPANPRVIYEGGDGGIFHSADGGATWEDLNHGLDTFQVEGLSAGPTGHIYIGTQDNGTFVYTGSRAWTHINDGDGGMTAADPRNVHTSYTTHYGASLVRNDLDGNPSQNVSIAPFWGDYELSGRGQFYEPFALAPSRPNDIFYGTYRVWRSKTRGGTDGNFDRDATNDTTDKTDWVPISFDLSCARQPSRPTATCDSDSNNGQGVSALAVSPANPNVMAAASANGHIWLSRNALAGVRTDRSCDSRKNRLHVANCHFVRGVRWQRIDGGLPPRFPTSLHFAPGSSTRLYVTYSGFDQNTPNRSGHIFFSSDGGRNWTDLNGGGANTSLPDLPFNDLAVNAANGHLYAAADFGVYESSDAGHTWSLMTAGLPGAAVYQIVYVPRGHRLVAGTYGRGVWQTRAP